jgi:hypothetical protein
MSAGPVADQPVRPRTPPGVGTPLRADGLPGRRHPRPIPEGDWGGDLTAGGRAAQKGSQRQRRRTLLGRTVRRIRSTKSVRAAELVRRPGPR